MSKAVSVKMSLLHCDYVIAYKKVHVRFFLSSSYFFFFVLPPVICTPVNLYLNVTNLPQEVLHSIHVTGLHIYHYVQLN